MKKLIAISVVFALVAGVAFAVDVSGTVIGSAILLKGDTSEKADGDSGVYSSGSMDRIRIDGGGEVADGVFGGYLRFDGAGGFGGAGNVWWKPIDQFKLMIGGNGGDGFIGKEGVTGWMFYQTPCDTAVADNGNTWGGGYSNWPYTYRYAFFEQGDGQHDVYLFVTPLDILGINIILPFISKADQETADVFMQTIAQIDLKLDFGNIALTYVGARGYKEAVLGPDDEDGNPTYVGGVDEAGHIFVYYGGSFGDISIDFGVGYHMAKHDGNALPIGIGLGVKYSGDGFGVKFRTTAALAGEDKNTNIMADVMPYFGLGDNLTAFVSLGLTMAMPDGGETVTGWHFNPFLQVGEEWGAKFVAGVRVFSAGGEDAIINWEIPIGMIVSF